MNDDVIEEVNENDASEEVVESQEVKTYTEEEVNAIREQMKADNQKAWDKRWGREKSKMEKEYAEKDELINLLKEQTGAKDLSNLLDISYSQYGIDRPNIVNQKDEEKLGKVDAQEILELDDETIEDEANRLAGISNRSAREEATFMELGKYLTDKKETEKRKKEIIEAGIDEEFLEDDGFKKFMGKFNKDIPLKEIVDVYNSMNGSKKEKPFTPGSLKDKKVKEESEYFTEEEFNNLTREDLKNPVIFRKAMKSKERF